MNTAEKGFKAVEGIWNKVLDISIGRHEQEHVIPAELSLVHLVSKARQEWEQAQALFNEAVDPVLIDHAIYEMTAAERKFIYLLKMAQEEQVIVPLNTKYSPTSCSKNVLIQ